MTIDPGEVGGFSSVDAGGVFSIRFGIYLPGVKGSSGFEVVVRIIHERDRFDPQVKPVDVSLSWDAGSALDLWAGGTELTPDPASHFGQAGVYLYRYQLFHTAPGGSRMLICLWFTDPFARQTDIGMLAAVECLAAPTAFVWDDAEWKTPELDDLVVYELHVDQFNNTFQGVVDRIPYLKSLGVNCLELMPVTSTKLDFDWGYGPVQYFAPNAAYGGPDGLRALVNACHQNGAAVILDLVYQHVDPSFPYHQVYADIAAAGIGGIASPMIGSDGPFGPDVDFSQVFAQEFFRTANRRWLDEYHVDGFRYDEVTDLYQGPTDSGYALLAYETYLYSRSIARFGCGPKTYSRVIQCAEALQIAPTVLRETYTNAAWQDELLNGVELSIASGDAWGANAGSLTGIVHTLDPYFAGRYPATKTVVDAVGDAVEMPVAPFQYLNSHDHSHLINFAGTTGDGPLPAGDRSNFYKMQPFAIALMTAQGVPMLWEGEEFCDNYGLASQGAARVNLRRDMNWEYFYDAQGGPLMRLYRILGQLRRRSAALRSRESFFYFEESLVGNSVVAYRRHAPATAGQAEEYAMVVINFGASAGTIRLPFPKAGTWTEQIDGASAIEVKNDGDLQGVSVPSWYGAVYLL